MTIYEACDRTVNELAKSVLAKHKTHSPLLEAKVQIDYVFAHSDDPDKKPALKMRGHRILGKTRATSLKERTMGRGDAEIVLDGDWWKTASEFVREGLLDHELNHLEVKVKDSAYDLDDQGRPKLKLRHHDIEVGWFVDVAERNGDFSVERLQAKNIMEISGQLFWPELCAEPKKLIA